MALDPETKKLTEDKSVSETTPKKKLSMDELKEKAQRSLDEKYGKGNPAPWVLEDEDKVDR